MAACRITQTAKLWLHSHHGPPDAAERAVAAKTQSHQARTSCKRAAAESSEDCWKHVKDKGHGHWSPTIMHTPMGTSARPPPTGTAPRERRNRTGLPLPAASEAAQGGTCTRRREGTSKHARLHWPSHHALGTRQTPHRLAPARGKRGRAGGHLHAAARRHEQVCSPSPALRPRYL
jgi:hypothetical protein